MWCADRMFNLPRACEWGCRLSQDRRPRRRDELRNQRDQTICCRRCARIDENDSVTAGLSYYITARPGNHVDIPSGMKRFDVVVVWRWDRLRIRAFRDACGFVVVDRFERR